MDEPITHFLLSDERFNFSYKEVKEKLEKLKEEELISEEQYDELRAEDILLKVKHRTYKKCIRQLIIWVLIIGLGYGIMHFSPVGTILIIIGIIISTSSFYGVITNKLTKKQIEYFTN